MKVVQCRVPEECPQAIADLYLACISFEAKKRPSAVQVMHTIEACILTIPGVAQP